MLQIIEFKTAELAKAKGFNCLVQDYYNEKQEHVEILGMIDADLIDYNSYKGYISAPTQSELQSWLREKHQLHLYVYPYINMDHSRMFRITLARHAFKAIWELNKDGLDILEYKNFDVIEDDFEKAMEQGLVELLNLVRTPKKAAATKE